MPRRRLAPTRGVDDQQGVDVRERTYSDAALVIEATQAQTVEGCLYKVARARRHRDELAALADVWAREHLHEPVVDREGDDAATWQVRLPDLPTPPVEWGAIASDVFAQLRSALDHLATFLVVRHGDRRRVRDAGFPVCRSRDGWVERRRKALPGVPDGPHLKLIESVQPFRDPGGLLWELAEMSNADKHRYLLPAAMLATRPAAMGVLAAVADGVVVEIRPVSPTVGDRYAPGAVAAVVVMDPPHAKPPPLHVQMTLALAFGGFEDGRPGPAMGTVREMCDQVEAIVRAFGATAI